MLALALLTNIKPAWKNVVAYFDLAFSLALHESIKRASKDTVAYFDHVFTLSGLTRKY